MIEEKKMKKRDDQHSAEITCFGNLKTLYDSLFELYSPSFLVERCPKTLIFLPSLPSIIWPIVKGRV